MTATATIAIVAEFNPAFEPHLATNAAIEHSLAALRESAEVRWLSTSELDSPAGLRKLAEIQGIWIAPGSPYRSLAGALAAIHFAREQRLPLLGTCGGFQHLILEYARNVLGFNDAQHAEYDPDASWLFIARLDCSLVGRSLEISLVPGSLAARAYGTNKVTEQYYCQFGVNPQYASLFSRGPLTVVGSDAEGEVRVVELSDHPFFVGTLFVPQMRSTDTNPHPLVSEFVKRALSPEA